MFRTRTKPICRTIQISRHTHVPHRAAASTMVFAPEDGLLSGGVLQMSAPVYRWRNASSSH